MTSASIPHGGDEATQLARQLLHAAITDHAQGVKPGIYCADCWTTREPLQGSPLVAHGAHLCQPCLRARDRARVTTVYNAGVFEVYTHHPQFGRLFRGIVHVARGTQPAPDASMRWRIVDHEHQPVEDYTGDFMDAVGLLLEATPEMDGWPG